MYLYQTIQSAFQGVFEKWIEDQKIACDLTKTQGNRDHTHDPERDIHSDQASHSTILSSDGTSTNVLALSAHPHTATSKDTHTNLKNKSSSKSSLEVPQAHAALAGFAVPILMPIQGPHGDFCTPAAFALAKILRQAPQAIATSLAHACQQSSHPWLANTQATAGYVNITLPAGAWQHVIHDINTQPHFGHHTTGQGQRACVEYVSANPTGPVHVAHTRGAVLGDVMANLLQANGYHVTREYFINDAGQQVAILAQSVVLHLHAFDRGEPACAHIPQGMYPGKYVCQIARRLYALCQGQWREAVQRSAQWMPDAYHVFDADTLYHSHHTSPPFFPQDGSMTQHPSSCDARSCLLAQTAVTPNPTLQTPHDDSYLGQPTPCVSAPGNTPQPYETSDTGSTTWALSNPTPTPGQTEDPALLAFIMRFAIRVMLTDIQRDLQALGVHMDVFTSEKGLQDAGIIQQAVDRLTTAGLVYTGQLPRPLGQDDPDWQPTNLLLFRTQAFGDTQDRPLQRAQGGQWTYFAGDIGYHAQKLDRGYDVLINVWGADHAILAPRLMHAVQALSGEVEILLFEMVHFFQNGQLLKMSKRAGTFVTIHDVLSIIDADALRFMLLTKKAETPLDLSLDHMRQQTKDNPVFYVQYAHARCCSVMKGLHGLGAKNQPSLSTQNKCCLNNTVLDSDKTQSLALTNHQNVCTPQQAFKDHHNVTYPNDPTTPKDNHTPRDELEHRQDIHGMQTWQNARHQPSDSEAWTCWDATSAWPQVPIQAENLVKVLADWPRQVHEACQAREPHRITSYLIAVAQEWHGLWENRQVRFVQPDNPDASMVWWPIVRATAHILRAGLNTLGIAACNELR